MMFGESLLLCVFTLCGHLLLPAEGNAAPVITAHINSTDNRVGNTWTLLANVNLAIHLGSVVSFRMFPGLTKGLTQAC